MKNEQTSEDMQKTITDNAGGGVRGLRARPSAELFQAVRHSYGINGLEDSVDLGGSSSLNLLVTDGDSRLVQKEGAYYLQITLSRRKLLA